MTPRVGFTLIEVLVAITLVATLSTLAAVALSPVDSTKVDTTGSSLAEARRQAIRSGEPVRVMVDGSSVLLLPDGRQVGVLPTGPTESRGAR